MPYRGLGDSHEAKLYRNLVKELPHYAIFRVSPTGVIESWNAGVLHVLGYHEPEFLNRHFADLFTAEDRERGLPEQELRLAEAEGRSSDERWHIRKDRQKFFADGLVTPIVDEHGDVIGFTKVLRDITERKLAEQAKDRVAEQLSERARALDMTHTIIRGLDGSIRVWTQGAEFLYGWPPSEAIGRSAHELLRTEFPEPLETINERLLEAGEWQGELSHVTKDGRKVTVASHWVLHAGEENRPPSVIEVNNDITEVKEVQASLEETNKKLERANDELTNFAYQVAHDVKEPLRGVSSLSQLLLKTLPDGAPQERRELLDNILQNSKKLEAMVNALLEYATVEDLAGKAQAVAVEEALKQVQSRLATALDEAHADFGWGAMPVVRAHPVRVTQLLQNLVANAIKFSRPDVQPLIRVRARRSGAAWEIAVADNGRGIDSEFTEKVFAPLTRLHGREISGAGLGLAICKRIVEGEGGRIWVTSKPGVGSTFYFTLPAA